MNNFRKEIKYELNSVHEIIKIALHTACLKIIGQLVIKSRVWTGSFIKSHRLGIDQENVKPSTNLADPRPANGYPPKVSFDTAVRYSLEVENDLKTILKTSGEFKKAYFTNNIPWAKQANHYSSEVYTQSKIIGDLEAQKIFDKATIKKKIFISNEPLNLEDWASIRDYYDIRKRTTGD